MEICQTQAHLSTLGIASHLSWSCHRMCQEWVTKCINVGTALNASIPHCFSKIDLKRFSFILSWITTWTSFNDPEGFPWLLQCLAKPWGKLFWTGQKAQSIKARSITSPLYSTQNMKTIHTL